MDQTQNYQMMNNFNNLNNINPLFNNGNIFYMQNQFPNNFNQMNFGNQMLMNNNPMMMQLNMNVNKLEFEDVYDYIKEPKKKIKFLRVLDNKSFNILIPCSLRKNELYFTAIFYKKFECSEIQLFHNETFLNDDETSIDCINEGDEIKIIEQLHGVDFSYYKLYLSKHKNEPLINIRIYIVWKQIKRIFHFTNNTSIEEMIKIIFNELFIPENQRKEYYFLFNGYKLNFYDKSTLEQKLKDGFGIEFYKSNDLCTNLRNGKNLEVLIRDRNKIIGKGIAGTLQTIKDFYLDIDENNFKCNNILLKNIKINGKELQKDDERTLSSIGII